MIDSCYRIPNKCRNEYQGWMLDLRNEETSCKISNQTFQDHLPSVRSDVLVLHETCWKARRDTYFFTRKLWWRTTLEPQKPETASEYAQLGDDVVVSAVTPQRIIADPKRDFGTWTDNWYLQETEYIKITCNIYINQQYTVELLL